MTLATDALSPARPDRYEIAIRPTTQDYTDYFRIIYRVVYRQNLPYMIAIWFLAIFTGSAIIKIADQVNPALAQNEPAQFSLALMVYIVLFFSISRFFWKYIIASRIEEQGHFLAPKTIRIAPDGYHEESSSISSHAKWTGIRRIEETKKCILLYIDKVNAYVIPKHALGGEQQAREFLMRARQYHRDAHNPGSASIVSPTDIHAPPAA